MADATAAERQRRYRAHKAGDHSLCPPGREDCATVTVTPPVTRNAVTPDVPELGGRGRRLWLATTEDWPDLTSRERVLLEEACRAADRLDVLDRILRGAADDWLRFHAANEDGSIVKVVVNGALMEVRQQQTTLARLLAELRQSRAGGSAKPPMPGRAPTAPTTSAGGKAVAGVTNLAARIAAKRGNQATG